MARQSPQKTIGTADMYNMVRKSLSSSSESGGDDPHRKFSKRWRRRGHRKWKYLNLRRQSSPSKYFKENYVFHSKAKALDEHWLNHEILVRHFKIPISPRDTGLSVDHNRKRRCNHEKDFLLMSDSNALSQGILANRTYQIIDDYSHCHDESFGVKENWPNRLHSSLKSQVLDQRN